MKYSNPFLKLEVQRQQRVLLATWSFKLPAAWDGLYQSKCGILEKVIQLTQSNQWFDCLRTWLLKQDITFIEINENFNMFFATIVFGNFLIFVMWSAIKHGNTLINTYYNSTNLLQQSFNFGALSECMRVNVWGTQRTGEQFNLTD